VAQAVESLEEAPAACGEEQAIGASVLQIMPTLKQAMLDQAVEEAHQRDRLQLQHVSEIDLGQALVLAQPEQHDPLRAGRPALLGAVVDVVAQQSRTLHKLCNQLPFQVE